MVRPRWHGVNQNSKGKSWSQWTKLIAILAVANLSWCVFDITYIPLRSFWLNRKIYISNSSSKGISLTWLPNITSLYDQIKGIRAEKYSKLLIDNFNINKYELINKKLSTYEYNSFLENQKVLTKNLIENSKNNQTININNIEIIKANLLKKSQESNYQDALDKLLSIEYFSNIDNKNGIKFWEEEVISIARTNYTRRINPTGRNFDSSWRIDIPFQLIFLIDIILRTRRLKKKIPGISWRNAFLKRWLDIPLFLPYFRLLRILPTTERLSNAKLIQVEPLRAVISQWIVAMLALELFEVITLRILETLTSLIKSPNIPERIRGLCSYKKVNDIEYNDISELIRLWVPILLSQIGPNMRPQLIALFDHALQRSISNMPLQIAFKENSIIEKAESAITYQLASGMVDTLLEFSKNAGSNISKKDITLNKLSLDALDRFWEELASALDNEKVLNTSQVLIISLLEDFKFLSFRELQNQSNIDEIMIELDDLNFNQRKTSSNQSP